MFTIENQTSFINHLVNNCAFGEPKISCKVNDRINIDKINKRKRKKILIQIETASISLALH